MRGQAGPWLIDAWMEMLATITPWAALHTSAPNPDDPTATEVVGAWYARKQIIWDTLDDTSIANAAPIKWSSMPAITIAGIAVYTTSTSASLVLWCPYATPLVVKVGGSVSVAAHDIFVEIV